MKNSILRAESFPVFEIRSSVKTAVCFVIEGLAVFLFASVDRFGFALSLALLCGLVFARQNILIIAPCFIVATCVFTLDWWSLLYSVSPVLVLIVLYVIFFKLKKNVPLWTVAFSALLGMIPYIACHCVFYHAYLHASVSALITVVLTFCVGIGSYAVFVRGAVHKATVDELICGGIFLVICAYALSGVGAYGFYAYDVALAFCILFCATCFKSGTALFVSLIFGIGATLKSGDISTLAGAAVLGGAAVVFSPFTKWSSALAMLAIEGILWLLDAYAAVGWQSLVMCAVGISVCLFIPKSYVAKVRGLVKEDDRHAYTGIINRRGREIATKLYSASDVFYDMSKNLESVANMKSDCSSLKLAKEVAKSYCAKCRDREICFSALGTDTAGVLQPMADAALNRGKVTILDMPPFITSRCSNMHSLASVINSSAEAYRQRQSAADSIAVCKGMMAQQFAGVSLVLDSLAQTCAQQVNFATDDIEIVKSELLKHNIVASEIVVSGENSQTGVTLLVRACDAQKAVLPRILSKYFKTKLETVKIVDKGEQKLVYLQSAPIFEVAYGIAQKSFEENVSGDSKSVLCPSRNRRLFAICDGMGHGESASQASNNAVKMIESFYRSGIDSNIILNLVNKLLKLNMDDTFSSLDIAVIDTQSGGLDVIKLGSASSFIIRRDNIEVLSCTTAPVGILDDVQSVSSRYQLYDGDMLLMMSDGVYDALENKGVADMIDSLDTVNPQTLADGLLQKAVELGTQDDCTVIALRLFAV